jgi:hypothetical protein
VISLGGIGRVHRPLFSSSAAIPSWYATCRFAFVSVSSPRLTFFYRSAALTQLLATERSEMLVTRSGAEAEEFLQRHRPATGF